MGIELTSFLKERKQMQKPVKHKNRNIVFGIVVAFILTLILIGNITVYPFMIVFRGLIGMVTEQGNIGPYAETIQNISEGSSATVTTEGYPDMELTFYYPDDGEEIHPVILYIHGGGWSVGNAQAVSPFAKLLASNGYVVANAEYALAPEHPYPTSTYQLVSALNYLYEHAQEHGIDKNRIFIGGNSAGAHLASQLGALASNPTYADGIGVEINAPSDNIKGLLLFNGVYNFDNAGECGFPFFNKLVWAYTGTKQYKEYEKIDELSTVKHITPDYPATFITVGDIDPLEPQTIEFVDVLENAGVDCTALMWTGTDSELFHDYIYELNTEEAQKAYEMAVKFLAEHSQKSGDSESQE